MGNKMRDYYQRRDRVTEEEAKKRIFITHGENITLTSYSGTHKYAEFLCNICGSKWNAVIDSVWGGNGCSECAKQKARERYRFSFDYVKEYIESENCILLSKEYINEKSPIEIEFFCGHSVLMTFESFKRGHRCQLCAQQKNNLAKRKTPEEINLILKRNKFIFIAFPEGYINRLSYIQYECQYGHFNQIKISGFLKNESCKECKLEESRNRNGSRASNWQGGLTEFTSYVHHQIIDWKKASMLACNYKCVITGERFEDIHHLYSFNLIVKEAISNLGLNTGKKIGDYSEEVLFSIIEEIKKLHKEYPLGVCLTKNIHKLFHNLYGIGDTTPEQFYEFQSKIASGEIQIS